MSRKTKDDLTEARTAYAKSLRHLAQKAMKAANEPTLWNDELELALESRARYRDDFLAAHNADRAADLAKLPRAE